MKILGIETSCDETAMSVIEVSGKDDIKVLSNIISSQVKLHAKYGGVVPSLAAREHVKNIRHVFNLTLKEAGIKDFSKDIDLIAVTRGPGLGPALLVGLTFSKTIAWLYRKPLIGVSHLEGHIYSNWLNEDFKIKAVTFPILHLVVSGGHTELVLMKDYGKFKLIGETMDDAVGEAFDKVARLLGLGYPGGPLVSKIAEKGDPKRFPLPRPMLHSKNFNFSYSGLKTAVLYLLRDLKEQSTQINNKTKADIAASFQEAAVDVLIQKTFRAAKEYRVDSVMLSGGVSANTLLRSLFRKTAEENDLRYSRSPLTYTTDNAAMIAVTGYFAYLKNTHPLHKDFNGKEKIPLSRIKMDANLTFPSK